MQNVVACLKEINFFLWDSIAKMFVGCVNCVNMNTGVLWSVTECVLIVLHEDKLGNICRP